MTPSQPCPECGHELPENLTFCPGCGARVDAAVEEPAAAPSIPSPTPGPDAVFGISPTICPGCGVIAPAEGRYCTVCEAPLEGRRSFPDSPDGRYWVGLRCHFQCRSCGHMSPLNNLDLDGSVLCHHCGLDQAFDVSQWHEGLDHAHAVGDLAGPLPEGRNPDARVALVDDNPFARIGVDRTAAEVTQGGIKIQDGMSIAQSLKVSASPGHPLCEKCHEPLVHQVDGIQTTVRCPSCGDSASYKLSPRAMEMCDGLTGIRARDHRSDRPEVKLERRLDSGVIALSCPSCGAGLASVGEGGVVTCSFCKTVARIPDQLMLRYLDTKPAPETWWLLFEGKSARRETIEDAGEPLLKKDKGKAGRDVELPEVRKTPLAIRLFLGIVIPSILLAVIGVLAFADVIIGLLR